MTAQELEIFYIGVQVSRSKHSDKDRLIALEIALCSIAASLEGSTKETFLKTMNSFSKNLEPSQYRTIKAIADLNVLCADFNTLSNRLADQK